MSKTVMYYFIVFLLLIAPVAHAVGIDCEDKNCQPTEQFRKHVTSEKQDAEKMADAKHHCSCFHVFSIPNLTVAEPTKVFSELVFVCNKDAMTSVVIHSPLRPPSHV